MLSKEFVLAGAAIFTLANGKGTDYTFRVMKREPTPQQQCQKPAFFVFWLTGPNNLDDYTYLGMLLVETGEVRLTRASRTEGLTDASIPVKAVRWALAHVWKQKPVPAPATLQHAGRCGRCARLLTVPESIETGLGPECSGRGYTQPRRKERKPKDAPAPTAPPPQDTPVAGVLEALS